MKLDDLNKIYDKMQKKYGAKELHSIYNGGCIEKTDICFVFMNPTGKNIASTKEWSGIRSPWIGTKNIWKLFYNIDLISKNLYDEIKSKKPGDWDEDFALKAYSEIEKSKVFITNLGKCTQVDARALPDSVYKEYLKYLYKEISIIEPKVIITFGNQVSSIILDDNICVSKCRKEKYDKKINGKIYPVYPVYYPIGNGMRNIDKTIEDIKYIISKEINNEI